MEVVPYIYSVAGSVSVQITLMMPLLVHPRLWCFTDWSQEVTALF